MIPIKHILYENGVKEIFKLIVPEGIHAGTYEIEKPDGWDDVDSKVNIDEELFFVKDFIIGDNEKLRFFQYSHKTAFDTLKAVYKEQGSDGLINFKWIAVKDGIEYDLLKDNFDVNLGKYSESYEVSMFKIELEIKKSEAQNKLFTREETTVDLFAVKDLDENDIEPVQTFDIGYKKGDKGLSNFYTYDISQYRYGAVVPGFKSGFFSFKRSDEYEFGDNNNAYASYTNFNTGLGGRRYQGDFIATNISLPNIKVEISNLEIEVNKGSGVMANASLYALVKNGVTGVRSVKLADTVSGVIKIDNQTYIIGNLNPGENLTFEINSNEDVNIGLFPIKENTSIEITTNLESPLVKTKGVRLISALDQLVKNYTSSSLSVISNSIGVNGVFYNTCISTGMYLRGLPAVYLNQKIKTSFKNTLSEGAAKLLCLGFDILNSNVVVEDMSYFFKDVKVYDLSEKIYLQDGYKIENDKDLVFNTLLFGSKKFSTNVKEDIKNFTTSSESNTPIRSIKNKLDKQTSLIIDEFKIKELIEDKSSSTNDNDDDLVLIDLVQTTDVWDNGVFENTIHSNVGGFLELNCTATPFDTTLIEVGNIVQITEGKNAGSWTVMNIVTSKMTLNKTSSIETGVNDTPIRYRIAELTKNRTKEGFTDNANIRNFDTATNIRHNPKYHMARWFKWFGSGLRKKLNSELIKITNYKNNSEAQMRINSEDLANELPDLVTVGSDETLGRLRSYSETLFNGDTISISYTSVTFEEFIAIYESWKYGIGDDRMKSRGYLPCNTPDGIYDVFPFGDGALSHNKSENVLTINGKIKGKSVDNPTLLSVEQLTKDTVRLIWEYNQDYINATTKIQYSIDGVNWTTLKEIFNVKTDDVQSILFFNIMTGTPVYFRVIVSTADYYNKQSNTIMINWKFNDWIYSEIERTIDTACGTSILRFQLYGTGNFDINWNFLSAPGGGFFLVTDDLGNEIVSTYTPYGVDSDDTVSSNHVLNNEAFVFNVQLKPTDNDGTNILQCNFGNNLVITRSNLFINIKNTVDNSEFNTDVKVRAVKRYQPPFEPGGPFDPSTDPF